MSLRWPPAQRLVPLATGVVAAHMLLLQLRVDPEVAPASVTVRPFATRAVAAQPPRTAPQPAPAALAAPAPVPAAPRPRGTTTAAVPEPPSPPPSDVAVGPITPPAPPASPPTAAAPAGLQLRIAAIPEPARLRYVAELSRNGQVTRGDAEFQWRHDGAQYEARWTLSGPLGLGRREQASTGRLAAEGLAPTRFADRTSRTEAVHFEREAGKVTFSSNRPQVDLPAGAQDRLSVIVQLAALLGGDPRAYPAGTVIAIPTASTRDAEVWNFNVVGPELLQLPGGARNAIKLQRAPRKEFDYLLELWLAPGMDYAPVRLRLTYPNGDSLDQRWSSTDKG